MWTWFDDEDGERFTLGEDAVEDEDGGGTTDGGANEDGFDPRVDADGRWAEGTYE